MLAQLLQARRAAATVNRALPPDDPVQRHMPVMLLHQRRHHGGGHAQQVAIGIQVRLHRAIGAFGGRGKLGLGQQALRHAAKEGRRHEGGSRAFGAGTRLMALQCQFPSGSW